MDKALLLNRRLPEGEVDIPGVGTVRVRGLTRQEMLDSGQAAEQGTLVMEREMLSRALLDPEMSAEDVALWQENAPANEITPVVQKVNELSGITPDAAKAAYKSDGDGPDA
jgi:hypothetical protein